MSKIRHFTNKMTRTKRTISNASLDADTRRGSISERARSVSEIMDSSKVPRNHEYLLLYLGYAWVGEPRSTKELQAGIRNVQTSSLTQRTVSVTHSNGDLTVMEISGDKLLESPLQYVAQVAPDDIKGSGHCVAISFHSGHNDNQCHVFQAKTNREAADVVQAIQKACRSATKGLKSRKTSDATFPRPKSSQSEAQRMPRPRMCMEDEDELLEFKKAPSAFSSSKKSHNRVSSELLSSTSPSSASSPRASINSSDSMASRSKSKRRNMSGIPSDGMFTREDRVNQLSSAVFKIRENNSFLKDKASKVKNPSTPFEDALYAMTTENLELLRNYLSCGHVSSNDTDVNGNTLLHYSVAMGRIDTVRIVCNSSGTSLEAPGWNDCHALHRAAAEGNIPILQLLLRRGVNVNGMDIMRRTPLHITCGKMELVECSIALLEYGAQIMATDVLGLRPCDVNPDLKEVQNRLINSACESFVSSQVRDSGLVSSPSATPFSSSPTSTRPSSIASAKSHDLCADVDGQLSHLLDTVSLRARALHRVYADKTRHSLTHRTTRSHDNLSELQEKDEDEMARKDRLELKFPSELQLYSTAYAVEGDANAVLSAMERLKTRAGDFK